MTSVERNPANRLRFHSMYYRGRSGSNRDCNGIQLKRCLHREQSQRLLLLPQTAGFVVPVGNRSAFNYKKYKLPQAASVYVPHHDHHFPAIDRSDVSRVQQKGGRSSSVVDARGIIISTLGVGKVHSRLVYRQVSCKASRQVKEFRLRLFAQPNCAGIFFRAHLVPTRFWNSYDYLHGHFHNAFYRRAQEKIPIPFYSGNRSIYSSGNSNRRLSNSKNHGVSQPLGRSHRHWISGHSVFLCLWTRWLLGRWTGCRSSKTFSSSRSTHRFYFFSNRRRVGIYRNNGNRSPVLDFYLERVYDRLPGQRPFRNAFSNRTDSVNRLAGFYKSGSRFRASSDKRIDPALYKHGRVIDDDNDAFGGCDTKYFRASGKTLMMN